MPPLDLTPGNFNAPLSNPRNDSYIRGSILLR